MKMLLILSTFFYVLGFILSCNKAGETIEVNAVSMPYSVSGNTLQKDGISVHFKGVNAMNSFGVGTHNLMDEWNIEIVREFIGNLREQPIDGDWAILSSDNRWLHPLQKMVDSNRVHGKVTILCPFAWVDSNGVSTFFTGKNPTEQSFYQEYKIKMRAIASHFKGQPDVWIQLWNEPYHWNNENNYTHDLWLSDHSEMIDNLRLVDSFENIIVVCGNEQGQSEDAILTKGSELLQGRHNILFDLHAYEKWLSHSTQSEIESRIEAINTAGFAHIFGEVSPVNVGGVMDVTNFLSAVENKNISTLAWLWNKNSNDVQSLMNDSGTENDINNNNWGSTYRAYLAQ